MGASEAGTWMLHAVEQAIQRAQHHLLALQAPDGFWVGELEADTTLTSEYLLLRHLLGQVDRTRQAKAVRYLRDRQLPDGSWNLFEGGAGDLSATLKAYFALKLADLPPEDPALARAREWIRARGGPVQANVFTKISLALFDQYPWSGIPSMPVEIMLLPRWSYFTLYEVSYWSRTVIVPLLIIMDRRPVTRLPRERRLDELWVADSGLEDPTYARRGFLSWKNFFVAVDGVLKGWEAYGPRPWRQKAFEAAHDWLVSRVQVPGGLGGIYPAMANAVLALRLLGYGDDHPLVVGQLKEIEALVVEDPARLHVQPCLSPVWDTALTALALLASGLAPDHPALVRAADWLLGRQVQVPGDWQVKRPGLEPGGWPFQFANDFYPDLDDAAVALMALRQIVYPEPEKVERAARRGLDWLLGMQGRDGGWASFDADNDRLILNNIPFADHGALLDPSTEDLTGRCLECLGTSGYGREFTPVARGIAFLRRRQSGEGAWYGRWGVNYLYGTWSALRGLKAVGESPQAEYIQRAVRWLESRQNPDGGWGECCESYADPTLAGQGPSTPSQTAWALLGLFAADRAEGPAVERGLRYLVETQRPDGGWRDPFWNGTGFPRVFFLKYHLYAHYFPLWALGVWRRSAR